jgi:hypothetical protein
MSKCAGLGSYNGPCGALDCETCHPGGQEEQAPRLVASGRGAGKDWVLDFEPWMAQDNHFEATCPNPECGKPQQPRKFDEKLRSFILIYECSKCPATWTDEVSNICADSTVTGGNSAGCTYRSNLWGLN